jgi:hypothetical protein
MDRLSGPPDKFTLFIDPKNVLELPIQRLAFARLHNRYGWQRLAKNGD